MIYKHTEWLNVTYEIKYDYDDLKQLNEQLIQLPKNKNKNLFYQVDKITYFISHSENIFRVGLIVKDSVIICEIIIWVFGTALFGDDFYPLKTNLGT